MIAAVENNASSRYQIFNASQPSLWDEESQDEDRQQELIDATKPEKAGGHR